jgi:hypothetical protein
MVVSQQELVGKQGGQELGLVVRQAAMPDAVGEVEGVLEPFMEGLDGLSASAIASFSGLAAEEVQALSA